MTFNLQAEETYALRQQQFEAFAETTSGLPDVIVKIEQDEELHGPYQWESETFQETCTGATFLNELVQIDNGFYPFAQRL
ncbi:hypothetical protein JRQ81_012203 [Phrynocephalus forsythii]|uniref:Uncharacterized protein n=1 Tax=Phrynocephalus forsythii TaxID=171643 RepID=A0A9Q0X5Z8_9SAUR|nr:hypothetical protein JRQ81_012203 [Phrynocephalus forsythii]